MKRVLSVAAVIVFSTMLLAGIYAGNADGAQENSGGKPQSMCPVMDDHPIDKNIYIDYWMGYRIYFCCKECLAKFKMDPAKFVKMLKDNGVKLEKAPEKSSPGREKRRI